MQCIITFIIHLLAVAGSSTQPFSLRLRGAAPRPGRHKAQHQSSSGRGPGAWHPAPRPAAVGKSSANEPEDFSAEESEGSQSE